MKIVILAGGTGTRFWPLSRKEKPKQFCAITSKDSMIKRTYDRFLLSYKKSDIYISCTAKVVPQIKKHLPGVPEKNFIVEPEKRDTAPAMGFVASYLSVNFPNEAIVFAPSDHDFVDEKKFLKSLEIAEKLVKKTGKMLDLGVAPTFPSTVLGYTHIGKLYQKENGIEIYRFLGHKEKPEYQKAKYYIGRGDYLWHASYYMWTPAKFLAAFQQYQPKAFKSLLKIKELFVAANKKNNYNETIIAEEYRKLEKTSFDYAITEKMDPKDVLIIKGNFGWSDIGAWDVLYNQLAKELDKDNNLIRANWQGIDTHGVLIFAPKEKMVATIGLSDMVIVDTPDALLICPHGRAQDVKKIVEKLEQEKHDKYL